MCSLEATKLLFVTAAGLLADAANSVAGGGTMITFPALPAAGPPPIPANVTSAIGLVPGYAGGAYAYRPEIRAQGRRLGQLTLASLVGGTVGALLVLITPAATFTAVVPYLVLLSCVLLLAQPWLAARAAAARGERHAHGGRLGLVTRLPVLVAAVYGSYFGAGLGVLLLAVLGIFIPDDLQRLNGLKCVLSLFIVLAGVGEYLLSGQAHPGYVAVLLATSRVGGFLGGLVAKRVPPRALRITVCAVGIGTATVLLLRQ